MDLRVLCLSWFGAPVLLRAANSGQVYHDPILLLFVF